MKSNFARSNSVRLNHTVPMTWVIVLLVGLLGPAATQAQNYYLEYQMTIGNTQDGTQNNSYDSGKVQSPNELTATLGQSDSICAATATPMATFGELQLTADCSINLPAFNGNGYGDRFIPEVGGGNDVVFVDALTPTSATLPAGTPVDVQIVTVYEGYIDATASYTDPVTGSSGTATVSMLINGNMAPGNNGNPIGAVGAINQTNTLVTVVAATVGSPFTINSFIMAAGNCGTGNGHPFDGDVNTAITSQTYVTVLTQGAGYTSASGTTYPALQLPAPILTIAPVANQSVLISWPAVYVGYVLQQNPALTAAGWIQTTNTISAVNGTNQVTVSSATNSLFFRLAQP